MQQGTIINVEPATGIVLIQPDDGSEHAFFHNSELQDAINPNDIVSFEISGERKSPSAPGVQAVNVKIIK